MYKHQEIVLGRPRRPDLSKVLTPNVPQTPLLRLDLLWDLLLHIGVYIIPGGTSRSGVFSQAAQIWNKIPGSEEFNCFGLLLGYLVEICK